METVSLINDSFTAKILYSCLLKARIGWREKHTEILFNQSASIKENPKNRFLVGVRELFLGMVIFVIYTSNFKLFLCLFAGIHI